MIDLEYMRGKIRAMSHAGYRDHEIGYALGWDCGRHVAEALAVQALKKTDLFWKTHVDYLNAAHALENRRAVVLIVAAFFLGAFFGWSFQ